MKTIVKLLSGLFVGIGILGLLNTASAQTKKNAPKAPATKESSKTRVIIRQIDPSGKETLYDTTFSGTNGKASAQAIIDSLGLNNKLALGNKRGRVLKKRLRVNSDSSTKMFVFPEKGKVKFRALMDSAFAELKGLEGVDWAEIEKSLEGVGEELDGAFKELEQEGKELEFFFGPEGRFRGERPRMHKGEMAPKIYRFHSEGESPLHFEFERGLGKRGRFKSFKIIVTDTVLDAKSTGLKSKTNKTLDINIYPNPNDGRFTLSFESDDNQPVRLSVKDISGKELINKEVPKEGGLYQTEVNLGTSKPGVYLVILSQGKSVVTKKITVNK